jgi:hypothetical protein
MPPSPARGEGYGAGGAFAQKPRCRTFCEMPQRAHCPLPSCERVPSAKREAGEGDRAKRTGACLPSNRSRAGIAAQISAIGLERVKRESACASYCGLRGFLGHMKAIIEQKDEILKCNEALENISHHASANAGTGSLPRRRLLSPYPKTMGLAALPLSPRSVRANHSPYWTAI